MKTILLLLLPLCLCAQTAPVVRQGNVGMRTMGAIFGSFEATAPVLDAGKTLCAPVYLAGTIKEVRLIANTSGSATIDVLTIAHGSWTGTASVTSITASATPLLSSAARYSDTTLTGWNKTIASGTDICFAMTNPSGIRGVSITLKMEIAY